MKLALNPELSVRLGFSDSNRIELAAGAGSERKELFVNSEELVASLLSISGSHEADEIAAIFVAELKIEPVAAKQLVSNLEENSMLIPEDQLTAMESSADVRWDEWGWRDALDFHIASQNMIWVHDYESKKQKPPIMTYKRGHIPIEPDRPKPEPKRPNQNWTETKLPPHSNSITQVSYETALHNRRTFRDFSDVSVSLQELSDLLYHSAQPILIENSRPFRPSPTYSLGHFYSFYVIVHNVEGLEPGAYFYNEESHSLNLISKGDYSEQLIKLAQDQPFVKNASFCMFVSVHWDQYMWKYRFSRSYRLALYEIASTVQTLLVLAAGLNLKTFITPAIMDADVSALLNIQDPHKETPLYIIGLGKGD